MANPHRVRCQNCTRHRDECGPISWSGLCGDCGVAILSENALGISAKAGPAHWRRIRGIEAYIAKERETLRSPPPTFRSPVAR